MTANGLIVSMMAILFLIFGYLGVPVAFSLIAGVVLCQEGARAPCCTRDEGGPFGAVL
jgi:hypothetical protein